MIFATNQFVTYKSSFAAMPKKDYNDNIRKCLAGYGCAILILTDGTIEVIGSNHYGQLGLTNQSPITKWTTVPQVTDVVTGSCCGYISILVRSDGQIYTAGYDGIGGIKMDDFKLHPTVRDIIAVSSTSNAIFLLTSSGNVLYSGDADQNDRPGMIFKPFPITDVVDISVSRTHALFLKSDGKLFRYGLFTTIGCTSENTLVAIATNNLKVKKITCGNGWSMIMDNEGDVYILGKIYHTNIKTFTKIENINLLGK